MPLEVGAYRPGWETDRLTVDEVEAAYPGMKPEWEALKAAMQPGDELWAFSSPAESWRHLAGRAGIVLLRNGEAVADMVTLLN